jgi:small conductance mechanosensitive channel
MEETTKALNINEQLNEGLSAIEQVWASVATFVIEYGFKIIMGVIILVVGLKLIKYLVKIIGELLHKSKLDTSLEAFLESLIGIIMKVFLFIIIANIIGIDTTSFITILGAAGLAIGLALQGSLSNFAGGVLILFLKPFVVGDIISEVGKDIEGYVDKIDIFYTTVKTYDNRIVVIPNGNISNNRIINHTKNKNRRMDLIFGVSYDAGVKEVRDALMEISEECSYVLKNPKTEVKMSAHGDSAIEYTLQAWCKSHDFIPARFELIEAAKIKFDEMGIGIPYPQRDVHLYEKK